MEALQFTTTANKIMNERKKTGSSQHRGGKMKILKLGRLDQETMECKYCICPENEWMKFLQHYMQQIDAIWRI